MKRQRRIRWIVSPWTFVWKGLQKTCGAFHVIGRSVGILLVVLFFVGGIMIGISHLWLLVKIPLACILSLFAGIVWERTYRRKVEQEAQEKALALQKEQEEKASQAKQLREQEEMIAQLVEQKASLERHASDLERELDRRVFTVTSLNRILEINVAETRIKGTDFRRQLIDAEGNELREEDARHAFEARLTAYAEKKAQYQKRFHLFRGQSAMERELGPCPKDMRQFYMGAIEYDVTAKLGIRLGDILCRERAGELHILKNSLQVHCTGISQYRFTDVFSCVVTEECEQGQPKPRNRTEHYSPEVSFKDEDIRAPTDAHKAQVQARFQAHSTSPVNGWMEGAEFTSTLIENLLLCIFEPTFGSQHIHFVAEENPLPEEGWIPLKEYTGKHVRQGTSRLLLDEATKP